MMGYMDDIDMNIEILGLIVFLAFGKNNAFGSCNMG